MAITTATMATETPPIAFAVKASLNDNYEQQSGTMGILRHLRIPATGLCWGWIDTLA
jgi:hypothetical protein